MHYLKRKAYPLEEYKDPELGDVTILIKGCHLQGAIFRQLLAMEVGRHTVKTVIAAFVTTDAMMISKKIDCQVPMS
jgi:hypothetical protein